MNYKKSLLLIACLVPALQGAAQIEDYTLPDGKVVKIDRSVFPDLKYDVTPKAKPADYVARRKARKAPAQLPPYVYNGQDKYFPPIFNQSGGSCGSAAGVGYQFTHEMNSYRDADASLPENQYPHLQQTLRPTDARRPRLRLDARLRQVVQCHVEPLGLRLQPCSHQHP